MRAIFRGEKHITLGERPDPVLQQPTDAIVRVVRGCVCGSDLWYYRGIDRTRSAPSATSSSASSSRSARTSPRSAGDLVIAPFTFCDGTCANCRAGCQSNCRHGGSFGNDGVDGGQGESVRAPFADATLVPVPGTGHTDEMLASLPALSDVMCTGHHAAVSAGVKHGDMVAVVGDGAVGLCAVIAAKTLGANRIIALSRHADPAGGGRGVRRHRHRRGARRRGNERSWSLTDGIGVDAALECVGTGQSMKTAAGIARCRRDRRRDRCPALRGVRSTLSLQEHRPPRRSRPGA